MEIAAGRLAPGEEEARLTADGRFNQWRLLGRASGRPRAARDVDSMPGWRR